MDRIRNLFKNYKSDLPAGIVVYFVALPLCLAIAQVSTGESSLIFSGIIAGIIGGIIIGFLSGSALGVSGPAAGLVVIVFSGIQELSVGGDVISGFKILLLAIVFAGIIQLIAGYLKAGFIGHYFPSSVIKGMLASIGIIIILKELPHALGYDKDFMGDEAFVQMDGNNTITEIYYAIKYNSTVAIIISCVSMIILILFEMPFFKSKKLFKFIPSALFVVIIGVLINLIFDENTRLKGEHLVQLPVANNFNQFMGFFSLPDFSAWKNPAVYRIAFTLAIIASLETLLCLEAADKLDPQRRISSANRELKAQGIGNIFSGLIGGLPITQVIVRSSANINSGGKSKLSSIFHGFTLLFSAIFIPKYINLIPLSCLAAILIFVGYKLAKISLFKSMYKLGWNQFIPFIVTIFAILATDLLVGILIGIVFAFYFIIRATYKHAYSSFTEDHDISETIRLELSDQVTFLNKGIILKALNKIPKNSKLVIDGSRSKYIDQDVLEVIHEFKAYTSVNKNIDIKLIKIPDFNDTK